MVIALCCEEIFEFGAIPFVNSWSYFLSYWSPVQKIIAYAYIFKCFPSVFL
jgi:hypothetical protein